MDRRELLKPNTELVCCGTDGSRNVYTIGEEVGRGASCIVYNGYYLDNSGYQKRVRIKECYPVGLSVAREEGGSLRVAVSEKEAFLRCQERIAASYRVNGALLTDRVFANSLAYFMNLYEANNTFYIVSTYLDGETLTYGVCEYLTDAMDALISTASVIQGMHQRGYLYLDLKPENVFVIKNTHNSIQLFDFDALIEMSHLADKQHTKDVTSAPEMCLRASGGFSAPELRLGRIQDIGVRADIYSIGALAYYLLFGESPSAPDCEYEAVYDYSKSRYSTEQYRDRLWTLFDDFFHHTLAHYAPERYGDMEEVLAGLSSIRQCADLTVPFLFDSHFTYKKAIHGREQELSILEHWLLNPDSRVLYVAGMGGIGKSTLVRHAVSLHRKRYCTVLYAYFNKSVRETIIDDNCLHINTIERGQEESAEEYFYRKLQLMQKITVGREVLLVLDNVQGEPDDDLRALMNIGWKLLIVTRREDIAGKYENLILGPIREPLERRSFFMDKMGRVASAEELSAIDEIIERIAGHTLLMELIAGQIRHSYLTVNEAEKLAEKCGFCRIADEKIDYEKDGRVTYDSIEQILNELFGTERMEKNQKTLLKLLACILVPEITLASVAVFCSLSDFDDLNDLARGGWITIDKLSLTVHSEANRSIREDTTVAMHPVIRETILKWEWTTEYEQAIASVIQRLLELNNFCSGLDVAEAVLDNCYEDEHIRETQAFWKLQYAVLMCRPRDREEYVLMHASDFFQQNHFENPLDLMKLYDYVVFLYCERNEFDKAYQVLIGAERLAVYSGEHAVKGLYFDIKAEFHDYRLNGAYLPQTKEEKEELRALLDSVKAAVKEMHIAGKSRKNKTGLSELSPTRIQAAGSTRLQKQNPDRIQEVGSTQLQMLSPTRIREREMQFLLYQCIILIRACPGKRIFIRKKMNTVEQYLQKSWSEEHSSKLTVWVEKKMPKRSKSSVHRQKSCPENSDVSISGSDTRAEMMLTLTLAKAWYYTLSEPCYDKMMHYILEACEMKTSLTENDLDLIDTILSPCANMLVELERDSEAAGWLRKALELCRRHEDSIPYLRKKEELYSHLHMLKE